MKEQNEKALNQEEKKIQNQDEEILNSQEAEIVEGGINGPVTNDKFDESGNNNGVCYNRGDC